MKNIVCSFCQALPRPRLVFFLIGLNALVAFGQTSSRPLLETEIYTLDNGLTVYLNEDHSLPSVFGAVAVKGGSKRDPADATGIAHYFEHIMFKGTEQIGTVDYASEKVYLDSIAVLYDDLAETADEEEKAKLQLEINRLSLKASEYAIPNEFDKILGEMGCTQLNAGTGNEEIVYYNILPANQVEKWLELYSHRFIRPVYRLFQSELETVYEEYNMYRDNRFSNAFERYNRALYPDHPYGIPVIGYPEHLKNPSIEKMNEYFETYYVANNMALVLSGHFSPDQVRPMIEKYFGVWRTGEIPPVPEEYSIQPFTGRNVVQEKLTPVKFGIRSYRSVPIGHPDEPVLDVINNLLSNSFETGLIDELTVDNKLMATAAGGMRNLEAGGEMVLFVPKILGQSLKNAEGLVEEKLDSLKAGDFKEELLEAVKTDIVVNYERNFEDQYSRGYMMIMAFVKERDWGEVIAYPERIQGITKDDVVRAARQYYGNDYLAFLSKTGFPKKPKILKPPFEPIPSFNTELKSEYARKIGNMPVPEMAPDFIEFGPPGTEGAEVIVTSLNPLVRMYYVENKVNDLFNLTLKFGVGSYEMPVLAHLDRYMQLIGTGDMSFRDFSGKMQRLGASYNFYTGTDHFNINVTGPDMHLERILGLVGALLYSPKPDESKIKNLYEETKASEKIEQEDPESVGAALFTYAIYGGKSPFLNRLSVEEVKSLTSETLLDALGKAILYEADIHYSGTTSLTGLESIIRSSFQLDRIRIKTNAPVKYEIKEYGGPVVFFLDDKKAIQSKNYFFLPGGQITEGDKPYLNAYASYLDGGMYSLVFQEIREFRSLAYATGASVFTPFYPDETTRLTAYVGTQADKTREAIEVMREIIDTPPEKSDRIDLVRKSLIQSINSDKPGFRGISEWASDYVKRNYTDDPRKQWVGIYKEMTFGDIVGFYKEQFDKKPGITTIIGDRSLMGMEWMSSFGRVIEVDKEDIFR